jgi:hypothetical protein
LKTKKQVAVAAAVTAFLMTLVVPAPPVQSLPAQASDTGEENANTHGPDGLALYRPGRPVADHPYEVDHPAAWDPAQYDGEANIADQLDHVTGPTVHAIYLYPSNGPNRFSQFAAMFQADAAQASALVEGLYGDTGVRFDMRKDAPTAKNPDGVFLDITVVKSKYNAKQLGSSRQFTMVRDELVARGFTNADKKYVVWLDAASRYCGQGELYQDTTRDPALNNNQKRTTSIVYRPYSTTNADGGFCRGRTLLHEVGHNLGALQNVAPNAFDGAHCNDDNNDVMCYTDTDQFTSDSSTFDFKNNDFWDPATGPLPWWTVNLSRFICVSKNCSEFNLLA